ncbi:MAG TPA: ribonuclease HII [Nitrososphaera sp.]|nr:ribonuclease HII [Nitrososphaera sp.]
MIINTPQSSFTVSRDLRAKRGLLVGGVDEAGRGSIIGPLVVAGIGIQESKIAKLRQLGVRDSKTLTPKARARLFGEIVKVVDSICVRRIGPEEVDGSVMLNHGLNRLEARTMAEVIDNIGADEVYVDSCDVNPARYRSSIEQSLLCPPKRLHSLHHADSLNIAVSAASIIAKITRDQEIQEIRNRYGPEIGSGYPSDSTTMDFIRKWVATTGGAPEFARKSWKPVREMLEQTAQCTLSYYGP